MDGEQSIAVLEALIADKGEDLLRTAILLAGSRAEGEDLLQAALERVIKRWRWVRGDPEGYLRRTLHHLAIDGWRARQTWRARLGLLAAPEVVPDLTRHTMPSVVGDSYAQAQRELLQAGISSVTVKGGNMTPRHTTPAGTVIAQSPAAGTIITSAQTPTLTFRS